MHGQEGYVFRNEWGEKGSVTNQIHAGLGTYKQQTKLNAAMHFSR